MPKVVAFFLSEPKEPGGCEIYRVIQPYTYLNKHQNWQASYTYSESLWLEQVERGDWIKQKFINDHDIYVFPRSYISDRASAYGLEVLFNELRAAGKHIVYEVDDDLTNDDRAAVPGNALSVAAHCDAITVSTPYLAELMQEKAKRPVYVLPNCVSDAVWNSPFVRPIDQDLIYIGLTGSPTHSADWLVLKDVLPELLETHPEVRIILGGYHPDYLRDLPQVECIPHLSYRQYASVIKSCDIVLAPLNDDPFNRSKSPIKVIEGMAARRNTLKGKSGALCIASDHPVYRSVIQHRHNGLLVEHTADAWLKTLHEAITDTRLRQRLSAQAYRTVWKTHNISTQWQAWASAYTAILKTPVPKLAF